MKLKIITAYLTLLFFICFSANILAQDSTQTRQQKEKPGQHFVDEDGDGYNDNAPDHDGDGIPNGLDPDWQKLKKEKNRKRFVDLDGDGIDDNLLMNEHQERNVEMQLNENGSSMEGKGKNQNEQRQKKRGNKQ